MDYFKPFLKMTILIIIGLFLSFSLYSRTYFLDNSYFQEANLFIGELLEGEISSQEETIDEEILTDNQPISYISITAEAANCRDLPSLQGNVVGQVFHSENLPVFKVEQDVEGRTWYEVYLQQEDIYAWVSEKVAVVE